MTEPQERDEINREYDLRYPRQFPLTERQVFIDGARAGSEAIRRRVVEMLRTEAGKWDSETVEYAYVRELATAVEEMG